jgi:hypothetical protein
MRRICNCCGRKLKEKNGVLMEDVADIKKEWGYFSIKDGRRDSFTLCEACYDRIVGQFVIPVKEEEMTELL